MNGFQIIKIVVIIVWAMLSINSKKNIKITERVISVESKVDNEYFIPSIDDEEIDNYIAKEISSTIDYLYQQRDDINITYTYQVMNSTNYVAYLFNYSLQDENLNKNFCQTYNFNLNTKKRVEISKDNYNEVVKMINYQNYFGSNIIYPFELSRISYLITDEFLYFFTPETIEKGMLKLKNQKFIFKNFQPSEKKIAITFDDGPSEKTMEIVDLLNEYNVKGTFFVLGENVTYYPDSLIYLLSYGHEIGNHSYNHPNFSNLSNDQIKKQINDTQEIIYKYTKFYPRVFRFPYGLYRKDSLGLIDLSIILWNKDSLDWKYNDDNQIIRNVLNSISDGDILLFHDFKRFKKIAVQTVIEKLQGEGYEFVTVSNLINDRHEFLNRTIYYFK